MTSPRLRSTLLVLPLLVLGCTGSRERGPGIDAGPARDAGGAADAAGTDGGAGTDAGPGLDASSGGDAGASCGFVSDLERGCTTDDNCVVGLHQTDCCGTQEAIGMNHSERDRFDTAEAACRSTYPACGCAPAPTTTDSGETALDTSEIQVGCIPAGPAMECQTYVTERPAGTP